MTEETQCGKPTMYGGPCEKPYLHRGGCWAEPEYGHKGEA